VQRSTRIWLALGTVYLVWGSTYLAIMVGIRTLPPLLMSSVRFALAGGILFAWSIRRGDRAGDRPHASQWLAAAAIGGLLLVCGNGGIAWAQQRVASGVAALIVACVPIFVALLEWTVHRKRVAASGLAGLAIGIAGVGFLVGPSGAVDPVGGVVIVLASLAWTVGSLYAPFAPLPSRPLVSASMQMLCASVLLAVAGVSAGELGRMEMPSLASVVALGYLVVVGSIVTYTAYVWLLGNASPSLVSTYAYVNPVVAVALGAAFLGEAVSGRMIVAGVAIVGAVALVVRSRPRDEPEARREGEPRVRPALSDAS
jgi:drug/metabolite transporter (DMT)-like permease